MPRFEDRLQTLCFRDGLVPTVEITVEIRLRFQIPPVFCTVGGGDSETASTHISALKPEKKSRLNEIRTHDFAMPLQCSTNYQAN